MGKKKKRNKKLPSQQDALNTPTKHAIGLYECQEDKQIQFPYGKVNFQKGMRMIMPHHLQIAKKYIAPIESLYNEYKEDTNLNDKKLLIHRYGGIGDLLCILPSIYELKKKYPRAEIAIMCSYTYMPIFYAFPDIINGGVNNIVIYDSIKQFDYFVSLESVVEKCEDPMKHIHDIYAEPLFINVDQTSVSNVVKSNKMLSSEIDRQGIGIQYSSNAFIRDYNIDNFCALINMIANKYPNEHIHLIGPPNDYLNANYIQSLTDGAVFVNGCGRQEMQLNETFEMVSTLKLVIAPDSSMVHCAGFCDTPVIGLYGPFPSNARISRYKNAIGIDGKTDCSPCSRHSPLNWCKWNSGQGICVNAISPDTIMESVDKIMLSY